MNAPANLLAINPEIRACRNDWAAVQRARVEQGYEWPTDAAVRAAHHETMARLSDVTRDAEFARRTLEFAQ